MDSPILETRNLCKQYKTQGDAFAVKNLNLLINKGSLYGLIGPDGAGKSTILRILGTVIDPTSGEVKINGYDVHDDPEQIRPHIGYMPQLFSLYSDLTVKENLNFFAEINQVPKQEKETRIQKMMSFTHLSDFQDRRARNLSGGMKKKLVLACSLVHGPDILILDEPSTGVDPVSRRELWQILSEVAAQGVTILLSTPYMDEAERCSEIAILFNGVVIAQGLPTDLKKELPFEIIEVKAKPRSIARAIVSQQKNVMDWRPVGDRLRIAVKKENLKTVLNTLKTDLSKSKAVVKLLRKVNPVIEDVFTYKVNTLRTHNESL
ncbi:MAG: ABC transporter ATP-binding protein [Anaerolineaceae bacterium]|nr:ABC transporter ATP-binding protein [Anaerolineaceae bacterium]